MILENMLFFWYFRNPRFLLGSGKGSGLTFTGGSWQGSNDHLDNLNFLVAHHILALEAPNVARN